MFIYRFSRLIKSKLLWGFLALLMVFAFVVADSMSGFGGGSNLTRGDETVAIQTRTDAERMVGVMTSTDAFAPYALPSLPIGGNDLARILANGEIDGFSERDGLFQQRALWKIIAAKQLADRQGLVANTAGVEEMITKSFVDQQGNYVPAGYANFLARTNFRTAQGGIDANRFQSLYADTWLPAQAATLAVSGSVNWLSPMERAFLTSTFFDQTTAYAVTWKNPGKAEDLAASDEEIAAWYAEHQEDYRRPEMRTITYVAIPSAGFLRTGEPTEDETLEAMQYHADHSAEFKAPNATNDTDIADYDEVADQVLAKVRALAALETARGEVTERMIPRILASSFSEVTKPYGEPKTITIAANGMVPGLQNPYAVREAVFQLELSEDLAYDAVVGTDTVYLVHLDKVEASVIRPLPEVKPQVASAVREAKFAEQTLAKAREIRATLTAALAAGTPIEKAVVDAGVEGLTLSKPMTFTLSKPDTMQGIDSALYAYPVMSAFAGLGVGALSEPMAPINGLGADSVAMAYVAERHNADPITKGTQADLQIGQMAAMMGQTVAADWLTWALETTPPTTLSGARLLK